MTYEEGYKYMVRKIPLKRFYNSGAKTLSWLLISNIFYSLSHWGLLVILVKYFTTKDVGFFTYATALAAPIFMLSEMQMKSVLVVEPENGKDDFKTYLTIRFLATTIAVLGLGLYCAFFEETNWIIFSVIVYKGVESMIDILFGYLQKKDMMILMSKINIIKTALTLIICFLVTLLCSNILTSLFSIICVSLLFYLVTLFFIHSKAKGNFDKVKFSTALDIIKKSFPLGLSVLFGSYITNYPRITVGNICGPEILAYFGAYSYLVIGVFQISAPITTFLRQRLSRSYQMSNIHDFTRKINLSISAFFIMGLAFLFSFVLFGPVVIKTLYNQDYVEFCNVIYYLIISQMLMTISGIYSTAILSFNIYTKQAFISFFVFVFVILCSNCLIKNYGIYGGAYISIIAAVISLSIYAKIYYNKIKEWKKNIAR